MELTLRRVTPETIARAREDEDSLEPFLQPEIPRELLERKLARSANLPSEVRLHYEQLLAGPPEGVVVEPALSLHKAWHGIHYLLTGERSGGARPLALAVLGDPEHAFGADLGHGPATYLEPEQVRDVARALAAVSIEGLRGRYDPLILTELEIYPTSVWLKGGDFDWLMQFYDPLPGYYAEAAAANRAMLVWLS